MTKKQKTAKKGLISRLMDKLDKKMQEQAKKTTCCCDRAAKKKGPSCC